MPHHHAQQGFCGVSAYWHWLPGVSYLLFGF